jgi:uncharacterized repeat protein (TIGR03943 family)
MKAMNDKSLTVLKAAVLAVSGLMFYTEISDGTLAFYINQRFAWLSLVAVLLFLLLALTVTYRLLMVRRNAMAEDLPTQLPTQASASAAQRSATHGKVSAAGLAIVAIPALLGLIMPARPLTASAIESRGIGITAPNRPGDAAPVTVSTIRRVPTGPRNILDWLRAFSSADDLAQFNGQKADVVGFVYRDPRTTANQFWVSRFTVSCCVADATAIGLLVQTNAAAKLKADSWVRVTGKFQLGEFAGEKMPMLVADKLELTQEPNQPYLYP